MANREGQKDVHALCQTLSKAFWQVFVTHHQGGVQGFFIHKKLKMSVKNVVGRMSVCMVYIQGMKAIFCIVCWTTLS